MSTLVDYGYRAGPIEVHAAASCVRRDGADHILRYQTFHVLIYLLERAGRLVSREELIDAIWHEAAVTDNALAQCIAEIRKALGDDPRKPVYVRTVFKVGYEFIAPVETFASTKPPSGILADPALPEAAQTAFPDDGVRRLSQSDRAKLRLLLSALLASA